MTRKELKAKLEEIGWEESNMFKDRYYADELTLKLDEDSLSIEIEDCKFGKVYLVAEYDEYLRFRDGQDSFSLAHTLSGIFLEINKDSIR